ncbi:MAG TPA: hypothetical protein VFF11_11910, partial [Candidatus Binatia bacterium]|nr:hypothetical protein [Candidatus Binatia bacterium]
MKLRLTGFLLECFPGLMNGARASARFTVHHSKALKISNGFPFATLKRTKVRAPLQLVMQRLILLGAASLIFTTSGPLRADDARPAVDASKLKEEKAANASL